MALSMCLKAFLLLLTFWVVQLSALLPARATEDGQAETVPGRKGVVSVTVGEHFPPFIDATLDGGGPLVRLVNRVFVRAGYDIDVNYAPWKRGVQDLRTGRHDVSFPYLWTEERAAEFIFSEPVLYTRRVIYFRKGETPESFTRESLESKSYCEPLGYLKTPVLKQLVEQGILKSTSSNTMEQCFQMLKNRRVDFVPVGLELGWRILLSFQERDDILNSYETVSLGSNIGQRLMFSSFKGREKMRDAFDRALLELQRNGEMDQLVRETFRETAPAELQPRVKFELY